MRSFAVFLLLCMMGWASSNAMPHDEPLRNAVLEERALALFKEFRCVVCEGQTIADSDATLAGDMRMLIRNQIRAGETDSAIRDYLRTRYGTHIFMSPPREGITWLLWVAPLLFILLGLLGAKSLLTKGNGASEGT